MFDNAKVQQMTVELEKFAREHEDIYVIPEYITPEVFALFRRMRITIRAVLFNTPLPFSQREIFGIPVLKMEEATTNFNERTALIVLKQKSVPFIRTALNFTFWGGVLTVPVFVMANDEISAIYDRLTLLKVLQQYQEDGLHAPPKDLATRFARGLTTFLDSRYQNFKYQFWDSREDFKPRYDFDDTAIVIQGPIEYTNNYTAETFKLYRSIYPNAPIVVSTWKNEATDAFRKECENNSVVLLENEPPKFRGAWNVNMQLESSLQGVKFVQAHMSAKFVLKTRTDQRINRFDFLSNFKSLIETFPPDCNRLLGRILLLDASKTLPFRAADFLAFGYVADIFRLYDIPQHAGEKDELTCRVNHPRRLEIIMRVATSCKFRDNVPKEHEKFFRKFNRVSSRLAEVESYILRKFYTKYIGTIERETIMETSWKFIRECCVIVGIRDIFLDWPKYENSMTYSVDGATFHEKIDFLQWLDMYRNFKCDWI